MKKIIYTVLTSLMLLPGCAGYLDQDPGGMNTIDKVFVSSVSTKAWWARMFSDDFMEGYEDLPIQERKSL